MKGVNPPATNLPHQGQETFSFPSTISTEKVIVFSDQLKVSLWQGAKGQLIFVCEQWGKEKKRKQNQWSGMQSQKEANGQCYILANI